MKDMKKGEQATFQIQKAENESPVKIKPRQKSGKQRPTMELARDKRVQNPRFFKFDLAPIVQNPTNADFKERAVQEPSSIRGGQLMRTQESLKIEKQHSGGDRCHPDIRGGQLLRTGVHEAFKNQSEFEIQSGEADKILEGGKMQYPESARDERGKTEDDESFQRIQFHRPWEVAATCVGVPAFQRDQHQGLFKEPRYQEFPTQPERVRSSLGFTRANQMTDDELRQVLERPRSNPTILQARPQYENFSSSHFPYGRFPVGDGSSWGDHMHGGRHVA